MGLCLVCREDPAACQPDSADKGPAGDRDGRSTPDHDREANHVGDLLVPVS